MASLKEDIKSQSQWIVAAFQEDGFDLNYSIESLRALDKFFDLHARNGIPVPGGRLSRNLGSIVFSIGSYLGETIIKNSPGAAWQVDDNDPEGEVNAEIHLAGGGVMWPMQRVMKRFANGSEDSLFVYGSILSEGDAGAATAFPSSNPVAPKSLSEESKPWWKFW
jgi:hypothetical protein